MNNIIQVKLREFGQCIYFNTQGLQLKSADIVIVEQERGVDYGHVLADSEAAIVVEKPESLRKIIRLATDEDMKKIEDNQVKSKEAQKVCLSKIERHKLQMKLVDAEYSFDRTKIIFYFTSEERVDFRELVKDLARVFKARIELRQIGVRDEAKFLGGFGSCGRELCCKSFLKDFVPVTIKMAKEEGLPLNPPKISGLCGRLMCCLSFEHEIYKEYIKDLPREGARINTPEGKGKVISVNILKRKVYVELEDGKQIQIDYRKDKK